jgi:hypothetical protein
MTSRFIGAARTGKIAAIVLIVSLAGCARTPVIQAASSGCAQLLPSEWKEGVAPAPLPDGDTAGDWISFADAQTGKLDMANGRTIDAIGIIERCEKRDQDAINRASRRWWQIR